ncbi:MAG TPA: hypothetical protein VJL90_05580 [Pseudorhodoplanes sp.]|nr:hypothetical protein [Pseudorhodoplanes sp.]
MTIARIAPWAILAATLAAVPASAQNWPSNTPGPGKFPDAAAPAPAAAGPGQFPPANAPTALPAQPGAVPPPSQWGSAAPQHPAWGGGGAPAARPGGPMGAPMGAGGPPGAPPCADEMMPLRNDAQTKGMAIKAAIDRKADRSEICKVFRTFVAAEAKFVKFATDNGSRCSVPAEAVKVMKANHSKSTTMSNRVCNAAAGPGPAGAPPPPSLSDALGTSRIPDSSNVKKGGTFDTLGGSAIAR